jgi:uncharacterized protein YbaR (Trm112 family)
MALACPQCKGTDQVLRLEAFWRSLSQDAEAKRDLACPPGYAVRWPWLLGGLTLAVLMFTSGAALYGAAVLLAVLAGAALMWRGVAEAEAARERWRAALYCRRCPETFAPGDGVVI